MIALPLLALQSDLVGTTIESRFSFFADSMTNVSAALFPLLCTAMAAPRVLAETADRFIVYTRTRASISYRLLRLLGREAGVTFLIFFASAAIPFALTMYVLPTFGAVHFHPGAYNETTASAVQSSYRDADFTFLLRYGEAVYGIFYAAWLGLVAALLSVFTVVSVIALNGRLAALALPTGLYLVETLVALVGNLPHLGIEYLAYPFGLTPSPPIMPALGATALALLIAAFAVLIFRRVRYRGLLV